MSSFLSSLWFYRLFFQKWFVAWACLSWTVYLSSALVSVSYNCFYCWRHGHWNKQVESFFYFIFYSTPVFSWWVVSVVLYGFTACSSTSDSLHELAWAEQQTHIYILYINDIYISALTLMFSDSLGQYLCTGTSNSSAGLHEYLGHKRHSVGQHGYNSYH